MIDELNHDIFCRTKISKRVSKQLSGLQMFYQKVLFSHMPVFKSRQYCQMLCSIVESSFRLSAKS